MTISADIQQLEPGRLIELFEVDCTAIGGDMLRFHGHLQSTSIWWQGNEYKPWPIQATGFKRTTDSQQPAPTLTVGDINGTISALCVYLDDLVGATVRRRRTLAKYLDAVNFQTDEVAVNQPFGAPDGVTKAFQLVGPDGRPVTQDVTVESIYRTDWQGEQLLYATPRTNYLFPSIPATVGWVKLNDVVLTPNAVLYADGVTMVPTLQFAANETCGYYQSKAVVAGNVYTEVTDLKYIDGPGNVLLGNDVYAGAVSFNAITQVFSGINVNVVAYGVIPLDDGWLRVWVTWTATTTNNAAHVIYGRGNSSPTTFALGGQMRLDGNIVGAYIPTTTASVTVTDYTLSAAGLVTLADAPAQGSALRWSGTGTAVGNPTADPTAEMTAEIWRVEQKSNEQPGTSVEFTLSSPLDFGGQQLPARQIVSICQWKYRDADCGYTGTAYFDANDQPVGDPSLDRCSMKMSGCQCRFGVNNPLPFGGFLSDTLS